MDEEQKFQQSLEKERVADKKKQKRATPKNVPQGSGKKCTRVEFGLWLGVAIIIDIITFIPYVGAPVGWLFNGLFWLFLAAKGLSLKRSTIGFGLSSFFETLFSPLPACIAYVVSLYVIEKIKSKIPIAGAALSGAK